LSNQFPENQNTFTFITEKERYQNWGCINGDNSLLKF